VADDDWLAAFRQATQSALATAAHLRAAVSAKLRRRLQRTQQVTGLISCLCVSVANPLNPKGWIGPPASARTGFDHGCV
jgi:hypothetical protein